MMTRFSFQARLKFASLIVAALFGAACGRQEASKLSGQSQGITTEEPSSSNTACLAGVAECRGYIVYGNGGKIEYYRNFSISEPNAQITRAAILIHSANRAASVHYDWLAKTAVSAQKAESALIIVPKFKVVDDFPDNYDLYWEMWPWGEDSKNEFMTPISTFTAVDQIIEKLADKTIFPNLETVVVSGYSAGGQFVQRYALANKIHEKMSRQGVAIEYIAGAPSSYVYLDKNRPVTESEACPDYDDYGYGLTKLYPYFEGRSSGEMIRSFGKRNVTFLTGVDDVLPDWLDLSCAAMRQGKDRYDRFLKYADYTRELLPEAKHQFYSAPGRAHTLDVFLDPRAQEVYWE
jgi:hypothetical protein